MSSYLDEHFESTWEFLEDTLKDLKNIFEGTKHQRVEDEEIMRLWDIVNEARRFRSARWSIERALQAGKAPTDEQIADVRSCEQRLFRELDALAKLKDEEGNEQKA